MLTSQTNIVCFCRFEVDSIVFYIDLLIIAALVVNGVVLRPKRQRDLRDSSLKI